MTPIDSDIVSMVVGISVSVTATMIAQAALFAFGSYCLLELAKVILQYRKGVKKYGSHD